MEYVFPQLFSPDDVDIRLQYISVSQLEKMVETGKLCIPGTEELQRMSNAWNDKERSSFIEAIMANLPIQLIYLDGSKTPWTVIDGVQRSVHSISSSKMNSCWTDWNISAKNARECLFPPSPFTYEAGLNLQT